MSRFESPTTGTQCHIYPRKSGVSDICQLKSSIVNQPQDINCVVLRTAKIRAVPTVKSTTEFRIIFIMSESTMRRNPANQRSKHIVISSIFTVVANRLDLCISRDIACLQ